MTVTLKIQLQDPYLALPALSQPPSTSSPSTPVQPQTVRSSTSFPRAGPIPSPIRIPPPPPPAFSILDNTRHGHATTASASSPRSTMAMTSPTRINSRFSFEDPFSSSSFPPRPASSIAPSSIATSVRSSIEFECPSPADSPSPSLSPPPPPLCPVNERSSSSLASEGTTELRGTLMATFSKPTKVASLTVSLNGCTHVAFLGIGRRAHYSRSHIRTQQVLMEAPFPSPSSLSPSPASVSLSPGRRRRGEAAAAVAEGSVVESGGTNSSSSSFFLAQANQTLSFPFSIQVPNHLPVSVTTPQGGTIYRLSAVLTLAKSAGILSFLTAGTTFTTSATVQVYRAGLVRSRLLERTDPRGDFWEEESEEGEDGEGDEGMGGGADGVGGGSGDDGNGGGGTMTSDSLTHLWPGHLQVALSIPYVQLPPLSHPDLHLKIQILRNHNTISTFAAVVVKSFQVALWERAIFRVQKAGADPWTGQMHVIGTRDRVIFAQRSVFDEALSKGQDNDDHNGTSVEDVNRVRKTIKKVFKFSVPSMLRTHDEVNSSLVGGASIPSSSKGNCSSRYRTPRALRRRTKQGLVPGVEEDEEIRDSEFGEISIEIQHFLRFSLFVSTTATASSSSTTTTSSNTTTNNFSSRSSNTNIGSVSGPSDPSDKKKKQPPPSSSQPSPPITVERTLGDISILLRGLPRGPQVDNTGLPTYLGSFSTCRVSYEEARDYESLAAAAAGVAVVAPPPASAAAANAPPGVETPHGNHPHLVHRDQEYLHTGDYHHALQDDPEAHHYQVDDEEEESDGHQEEVDHPDTRWAMMTTGYGSFHRRRRRRPRRDSTTTAQTPPTYEETISGRPSLDTAMADLQSVPVPFLLGLTR